MKGWGGKVLGKGGKENMLIPMRPKKRWKTFASPTTIKRAQADINRTIERPGDEEAILFATIKGYKTYETVNPCTFGHCRRRFLRNHACVNCVQYVRDRAI